MNIEPESSDAAATARPVRRFGRLHLLRLLGKSERTMAWRVADPRAGREFVLVLPRRQPAGADELERWLTRVRRASRVQHPHLAGVVESGVQDGWPFVVYDPVDAISLADRMAGKGLPAPEVAAWSVQALEGLAFAHEAGAAHHDIQPFLVLLNDKDQCRLMGLEVSLDGGDPAGQVEPRQSASQEARERHAQRQAAQRDVLAFGLVMHVAIAGEPALGEPDIGRVIAQMPPVGREFVRLPWTTVQPVPEALRAICNRAADRQERHRYRNARTLAGALQGWIRTSAESDSGPLSLLLDRLHSVGVLPASPGAAARAARMAMMEKERTNELAAVVIQDMALSFEMLRAVNTAEVRGAQIAGSGPVLTIRRSILMLGLDGVRRAALALRPWPGPLDDSQARDLDQLYERVRRAARLAQSIRPPGYDAEVVYLVTLMQNLGRLVVQYHFPDDAQQVRRLMQPARSDRAGEPDEPGMSEEVASFGVFGVDIEALGAAVARHLGLDSAVLHMIRRLPDSAPVRTADNDDDLLRALASCANEAVDALDRPMHVAAALQRVAQRYGRILNLQLRDLQAALELAPSEPTRQGEFEQQPVEGV